MREANTARGDTRHRVHLVNTHRLARLLVRADHHDTTALLTQNCDLTRKIIVPFRSPSNALELAQWQRPASLAERRQDHDSKIGVVGGTEAAIDAASAMDRVCVAPWQRSARRDRVHQLDARIAI